MSGMRSIQGSIRTGWIYSTVQDIINNGAMLCDDLQREKCEERKKCWWSGDDYLKDCRRVIVNKKKRGSVVKTAVTDLKSGRNVVSTYDMEHRKELNRKEYPESKQEKVKSRVLKQGRRVSKSSE